MFPTQGSATQACAVTGNRTGGLSVCGTRPGPKHVVFVTLLLESQKEGICLKGILDSLWLSHGFEEVFKAGGVLVWAL